jgi:hypothetical protein
MIGARIVGMSDDADELRTLERRRLRSLVEGDLDTAGRLHADDYELITPRGVALSKSAYLASVASRELDYTQFEPVSEIAVRIGPSQAVLRYRAAIDFGSAGRPITCWHTDVYERHDGRWQVVLSQATTILE